MQIMLKVFEIFLGKYKILTELKMCARMINIITDTDQKKLGS